MKCLTDTLEPLRIRPVVVRECGKMIAVPCMLNYARFQARAIVYIELKPKVMRNPSPAYGGSYIVLQNKVVSSLTQSFVASLQPVL